MVAPEYYAAAAVTNLTSAISIKKNLEKLDKTLCPPGGWCISFAFYANMGGFAIRSDTARRDKDLTQLTRKNLLQLLNHHTRLHNLALPSSDEIDDHSKSDNFAKALVMLQIIYFGANCLTRLIKGLPITQLEMSVLGTAVCSLLAFALLFRKPRSIKTVKVLMNFDGNMPEDIEKLFEDDETHDENETMDTEFREAYTFTGLAVILGAFHVAAWNFAFPSDADKWIWRVCSLLACAMVPAWWFVMLITDAISHILTYLNILSSAWSKWTDDIQFLGPLFLYIIVRLILAAEMIRFLFYLPPGALKSTWADNIPHI